MLRQFPWIQNHWNEIMEIPKNNQTDTQDRLGIAFFVFYPIGLARAGPDPGGVIRGAREHKRVCVETFLRYTLIPNQWRAELSWWTLIWIKHLLRCSVLYLYILYIYVDVIEIYIYELVLK